MEDNSMKRMITTDSWQIEKNVWLTLTYDKVIILAISLESVVQNLTKLLANLMLKFLS